MGRHTSNLSAVFTARAAIAALKGDKTLAEPAEQFDVHPNQTTQSTSQLPESAAALLTTAGERRGSGGPSVKDLQDKVGQLAMQSALAPKCGCRATGCH